MDYSVPGPSTGTHKSPSKSPKQFKPVIIYPDEDETEEENAKPKERRSKIKKPLKVTPITFYFQSMTRGAGSRTPSSSGDGDSPFAPSTSPSDKQEGELSPFPSSREPTPEVLPSAPSPQATQIIPKKIPCVPDFIFKQKTFNRSISCRGCHKIFLCQVFTERIVPHVDYFNHCYNCSKYLKLKLTVDCDDCGSVFLNQQLYDDHLKQQNLCVILAERNKMKGVKTALDNNPFYFKIHEQKENQSCPARPSSMNVSAACDSSEGDLISPPKNSVYLSSTSKDQEEKKWKFFTPKYDTLFTEGRKKTLVSCSGCLQQFRCIADTKTKRLYTGRDYHVHCIECLEYKRKIRFCAGCYTVFLFEYDYDEHLDSPDFPSCKSKTTRC